MQYCVSRPDHELQQKRFPFEKLKWETLKKILCSCTPSGIESGMFQIGKLAVVSMIATLGTEAIAANAVGLQIIDFPNIPGTVIGLARSHDFFYVPVWIAGFICQLLPLQLQFEFNECFL